MRAWTLSTTGMSQTLVIISMAAFQCLLVAIKLQSSNHKTTSVLVTRTVRALYHFTHTQTFTNNLSPTIFHIAQHATVYKTVPGS